MRELEKKSFLIKAEKAGETETVEIGNMFGTVYVAGENRKEAAEWLQKETSVTMHVGGAEKEIEKMRDCENKFNVVVGTLY